jgi:hypothetical protein
MATRDGNSPPVCFISYSWDSEGHKDWVRELASTLHGRGVRTLLDQWELQPGDDFVAFMERGLEQAEFVLLVCTPAILQKEARAFGGVFYESRLIRAELFMGASKPVIPILREGSPRTAVPPPLRTTVLVDFSDDRRHAEALDDLVRRIHGRPKHQAPPVSPPTPDGPPSTEGPPSEAEPEAVGLDDAETRHPRRLHTTRTTLLRAFDAFVGHLDSVHHRQHQVKVRVFYVLAAAAVLLLLVTVGVLAWQGLQAPAQSTSFGWLPMAMLALAATFAAAWLYRTEDRCEQSVALCRIARQREDHKTAIQAISRLTCYGWLKRQFQDHLREFTR